MAQALRDADAGGSVRLVRLVARYGGAIEADLAELGLDLGQLWRDRRWRRLLNLIDHLPRSSYFVEAMADDPELAEHLARRPAGEARQRLSEWSADHDLLVNIFDRLGDLIVAVVLSGGGKAPTVKRAPRPVTAVDRARSRAALRAHERLVDRLLPPGGG